jgi:cytoskeletal protein RodZ
MKKQALSLDQERAEKLREIGSCLRELRQQQSVSLEEVASKTKIQQRLLNAIEAGHLEQLPEPVYIQGFIKQFADALGANGAELANSFPTRTMLRPIQASWRHLPAAQLRPIHLYMLYVFLIVFAVNGLSYLMNRSGQSTLINVEAYQPSNGQPGEMVSRIPQQALGPVNPFARQVSQDLRTNQAEAQLTPTLSGAQKQTLDNKPVKVSVIFRAQSWIRVVTDGKTEFEGVLPEGTERIWVADEQLVLRAGNAGGILVGLNGNQAKQLGDPGAVEEVTFEAGSQAARADDSLEDWPQESQISFRTQSLILDSDRVASR